MDLRFVSALVIILLVAALAWFQPWQQASQQGAEASAVPSAVATATPSQIPSASPTVSSISPDASATPYQNLSPDTVEGQLEVLRMPGCSESYDVSEKVAACMNRSVVAIVPTRDANGCIIDVTC